MGSADRFVTPGASCAACMDQNCCGEASGLLYDDGSCTAVSDCLLACGDEGSCRSRCASFLNRTSALIAVQACRESHCSAECGYSCGGLGYNAPGCDTCVRATCCEAAAKMRAEPRLPKPRHVSQQLPLGVVVVPPPLCDKASPGGTADYAAWRTCTQGTCGEACRPGHDWSCLDAPMWPSPSKLEDITFSVTIAD